MLRDSLFCQLQKLIVELGDFLEIGVVDGAELLKKLQSFPFLKFYVDIFDEGLEGLPHLLVIGVFINFAGELLDYFFEILRGEVVDLLK